MNTTTAYININVTKSQDIYDNQKKRRKQKNKAFHSHSNSTSMIGTNMIIDWISFQIRTPKQRSVLLAAGTARKMATGYVAEHPGHHDDSMAITRRSTSMDIPGMTISLNLPQAQ